MSYRVYVDDNFHYRDESERLSVGEYKTAREAIAKCREIVRQSIESLRKPGMTPAEVYANYITFGDDPYIAGVKFCAWDYAKQLAAEMCK